MRARPPHFLLTNYAMLEYLLLRPDDSEFFDGKHAGRWRFFVLDEKAYRRFIALADQKKYITDADLIYIVETGMETPAAI